ncbi:MBL fold metallo-hydrolase [Synechococcus sp. PCC 7336]|uniref:MBL fold metallo-hydrolase n=1 Tax=Synechococcus sp. PCC 7336 TaxID=195250 RepID=UPI00034B433B|nr:MBL fold metallo-hydrolase [Synechococcus sp. PCC 7336]
MQRRKFLQIAGSILGGLGAGSVVLPRSWAQENASLPPTAGGSLTIEWLYHSCVLFQANNLNILVNPFRPIGCTAGYPTPDRIADLVLLSSRLLDEGAITSVAGNPRVLFEAGDYRVNGLRIQGVRMARKGLSSGRQFPPNIAWRWTMGGIDIVHLGGAADRISREQEILLSKPDLMFVPVGGGPKNYDASEAMAAIDALQPKMVVPTMYRTELSGEECDLEGIETFLQSLNGLNVSALGSNRLTLSASQLPEEGTTVRVFPS